jgi:cardiolipin synthase
LGGLGFTDTLDGRIARRFHQESKIGKVADPLVDRVLVLCAGLGGALVGALPWWLLALVVLRELLVLVGAVVLAFYGARQLEVSRLGKAGALGMMIALPWFLVGHAHFRLHAEFTVGAWAAAAVGLAMAWAAAFAYIPQARECMVSRRERTR